MKHRWTCEPCDHKWWQHKDPNPEIRYAGIGIMVVGAGNIALGVFEILRHR